VLSSTGTVVGGQVLLVSVSSKDRITVFKDVVNAVLNEVKVLVVFYALCSILSANSRVALLIASTMLLVMLNFLVNWILGCSYMVIQGVFITQEVIS